MAIEEEEDVDEQVSLPDFLRDPLGIPRRHWLSMTLAAVLGSIVAVAAGAVWKPSYKATTTLLVAGQQIPKDFVKTTVEEDPFNHIRRVKTQRDFCGRINAQQGDATTVTFTGNHGWNFNPTAPGGYLLTIEHFQQGRTRGRQTVCYRWIIPVGQGVYLHMSG